MFPDTLYKLGKCRLDGNFWSSKPVQGRASQVLEVGPEIRVCVYGPSSPMLAHGVGVAVDPLA
jgi:hypothetical protein